MVNLWLIMVMMMVVMMVFMMVNNYLVGGFNKNPLKNMRSSVGKMTFPTEWKNKIHVPNHQPVIVVYCKSC